MKKIRFAVAAVFACIVSSLALSAQDECMLYLSYYQEYFKQGTKDAKMASLPSWRKAYELCAPGTRQNLYVQGATLYRMLIAQNAKNPEYKAALIDTLITLDKLRAQYYPKYAKNAYDAMSADVNNYLKNDPEKTHEILSEIVNIQGAEASPVTFVALMNSSVKLFKEGKLSAEAVINDYDNSAEKFSILQQTDTTQNTRNLRTTFENAFINSNIASCENLIALFEPRFEQSKDDYASVSKMVKLLARAENCTETDLFLKAVTAMHNLQPNANSAYYLFRLNAANNNTTKALSYMEEACASDALDAATHGQYYFEMSAFCLKHGMYAKAIEAANKAITFDSTLSGRAYMLIAHSWMSIGCGGNEVERRAKYWVACDYFAKARNADEDLAEEVAAQIKQCSTYFPQTAEAFMYDIQNGQSYTVVCGGLRATTTVRTN